MSDPYKRDRRMGRWKVTRDMLLDYRHCEELKKVQSEVLIVGTNYDIMTNVVEFHGISEHFDIVPEGNIVPWYKPILGFKVFPHSGISVLRWEKIDGGI